MRSLLIFAGEVMKLVALLGCVYVAFGGVCIYMVVSGSSIPGEPMFLDALTPALADSMIAVGIGLALIVAALVTRVYVRRKVATMQTGPEARQR